MDRTLKNILEEVDIELEDVEAFLGNESIIEDASYQKDTSFTEEVPFDSEFRQPRKVPKEIIVGICLGGLAALVLAALLFFINTRGSIDPPAMEEAGTEEANLVQHDPIELEDANDASSDVVEEIANTEDVVETPSSEATEVIMYPLLDDVSGIEDAKSLLTDEDCIYLENELANSVYDGSLSGERLTLLDASQTVEKNIRILDPGSEQAFFFRCINGTWEKIEQDDSNVNTSNESQEQGSESDEELDNQEESVFPENEIFIDVDDANALKDLIGEWPAQVLSQVVDDYCSSKGILIPEGQKARVGKSTVQRDGDTATYKIRAGETIIDVEFNGTDFGMAIEE